MFTGEVQVQPRRKWPLVVMGAMIVGGAAGAVGVMMKSRNATHHAVAVFDAGTGGGSAGPGSGSAVGSGPMAAVPRDAATVAVLTPPDAGGAEPPAPVDAGVAAAISVDAAVAVAVAPRDASVVAIHRPHDPRPRLPVDHSHDHPSGPVTQPETVKGRGTYMVQVLTKPEGANLYVGATYRGPGGTSLEERPGTHMSVECRLPGYKPGSVDIMFDGKSEVALCVLKRIKICINNIKNPFDDCEVDPSQPSPSTPVP